MAPDGSLCQPAFPIGLTPKPLNTSLFYNQVLNSSCNVWNTVPKVKTGWLSGYRMVVSVLVVYPGDRVADQELPA